MNLSRTNAVIRRHKSAKTKFGEQFYKLKKVSQDKKIACLSQQYGLSIIIKSNVEIIKFKTIQQNENLSQKQPNPC